MFKYKIVKTETLSRTLHFVTFNLYDDLQKPVNLNTFDLNAFSWANGKHLFFINLEVTFSFKFQGHNKKKNFEVKLNSSDFSNFQMSCVKR